MPTFNGRFGGDNDYAAIAKQVHFRHRERLRTQGLDGGRYYHDLPDGSKVVSIVTSSMQMLYVVTPKGEEKHYLQVGPVDYYSGIIWGQNLNTVTNPLAGALSELDTSQGEEQNAKDRRTWKVKKLYSLYPTEVTATAFAVTDKHPEYFYEFKNGAWNAHQVTKLAVTGDVEVAASLTPLKNFEGQNPIGIINVPHKYLKPSCFTGTMRKYTQFLLGIGKVPTNTIYARMGYEIAAEVTDAAAAKQLAALSDGRYGNEKDYVEKTDALHTFSFDFQYDNCHNVLCEKVGEGFRWWNLWVSQALGVIARPMDLDPISVTPEFKKWLEKQTSTLAAETLEVVEFFGGIPTGAGFEKDAVEAWIKAGFYVRLAGTDALEDYITTTTWSTQTSWAFKYTGADKAGDAVAKVVAYEDIDLGSAGNGYSKMCRAVRQMMLTVSIEGTGFDFEAGENARYVAGYLAPKLDPEEPWEAYKLARLSEETALELRRILVPPGYAAPIESTINAAYDAFQSKSAVPLAEGSAKLDVLGRWSFSPPLGLFKVADHQYDMCTSLWLPPLTVIAEYGRYKAPPKGTSIPIYYWFTDLGEERAVMYYTGSGEDGQYRTVVNGTVTGTAKYETTSAQCYVKALQGGNVVNDKLTGYSYEYYSEPDWYWTYGFRASAANDITPEGMAVSHGFWRKQKIHQNDGTGGPDFDGAKLYYKAVYLVLNDAEAALEYRYEWEAGNSSYTASYTTQYIGSPVAYDWEHVPPYVLGVYYSNARYKVSENQVWNYGYPIYASWPENADEYYSGGWQTLGVDFKYVGWVRHWAKPGTEWHPYNSAYSPHPVLGNLFNVPPHPGPESVSGTPWVSKQVWALFHGRYEEELVPSTTPDQVHRSRAVLDILELQPSLYNPPENSPYVEHDYRGTSNAWGAKSAQYMEAPNNYNVQCFGEVFHENQEGDAEACFVGVVR